MVGPDEQNPRAARGGRLHHRPRPARIAWAASRARQPDGYTLSIGHWATHVINAAIYPLQYDVLKDLEPVGMICANPC